MSPICGPEDRRICLETLTTEVAVLMKDVKDKAPWKVITLLITVLIIVLGGLFAVALSTNSKVTAIDKGLAVLGGTVQTHIESERMKNGNP
jgi:hypothetical protein